MPSVGRKFLVGLFALLVLQALAQRGSGQVAAAPEPRSPQVSRPDAKPRAAAPARRPDAKPRAAAPARRPDRTRPRNRPGVKRCPVAGPVSFVDSWHAPRDGHLHQGVDMMAAQHTTLVAVENGTIGLRIGYNGISGNRLSIYGASGTRYFYAHLSRIDVHAGQRVHKGQRVGLVGRSGNAYKGGRGAPHLHFELRPGNGPTVNPYPSVKAWCG